MAGERYLEELGVCKSGKKLRSAINAINSIILLLILGVAIYGLLNYSVLKSGITVLVEAYGLAGLFLIIVFLDFIPQFISPFFGIGVAIIAGINVHVVLIVAIAASLLGSCLGFFIGRRYGERFVPLLFKRATIERMNNFWKKYDRIFVLVSALTVLPFISMIFGALKMKWGDFIIFGVIPRIILKFIILTYAFYFGFWNLLV